MSTGYLPPRYEETRASVVSKWKSTWGSNANTASDNIDGLQIDIWSLDLDKIYQAIGEQYNQTHLFTATGLSVDAIIYPLTGVLRTEESTSTVQVFVYGDVGTVVADESAISTIDTGSSFEMTDAVTIVAGTYMVLTFPDVLVDTSIDIDIGGVPTNAFGSGSATEIADLVRSELLATNTNVENVYPAGLQPDGQAILLVQMTSSWAYSIAGAGTAYAATSALANATNMGPVSAAYGTLTVGAGDPVGWAGVTNIVDATLGAVEESDGAYKIRTPKAMAAKGNSTPRALAGRLAALQGVEAVKIYENVSDVYDSVNGRPPHSFEPLVVGGSDSQIAEAIWLTHTTGTQSYGSTTYMVVDKRGLVDQPRFIGLSRPIYRYAWVRLTITRGEGFPLLPLSDIKSLLAQDIATWGNTLGIGRDVYLHEVVGRVTRNVDGVANVLVELAATPAPSDSPTYAALSLFVAQRDYTRFAATRVTVNIV